MNTTLRSSIKRLPKERRARIEKRAAELMAAELCIRDLRRDLKFTQKQLAGILNIGQDGISRLEKRDDLRISTLSDYVRAMGGKLRLVVEFPSRPPVILTGLAGRELKKARSKKSVRLESKKR